MRPGRYIEFCKSTFPTALDLRGLKIVLDCAHGATYHVAPPVFHELGAEIITIGDQPDGLNINDQAGSTYPETLCKAVVEHKADIGIAFDGDGDRVVMVDANGTLLDGDQLLYIIAMHARLSGKLEGGVVGTLMTNLALEHALGKADIPFLRAKVGDRYVLELLNEHDWRLGGRIPAISCAWTSTAAVTASSPRCKVLHAVIAGNKTLAELGARLVLYPQVLINVTVAERINLDNNQLVQASVKSAEQQLNGNGRVLLRASGTEPKIRVNG